MYILTEIIGVISEVLIIYLFIQGVFLEKEHPRWVTFCFFIAYGFGLLILSFMNDAAYLRILFCGSGILLLVLLLFEAKLIQAVFMGISFCAIYMMIDILIMLLASLLHIDSDLIMSHSISRCVYIATTHIFLLVAISVVLCFVRHKSSAITFRFVLVLSPGYIMSIWLGLSFCQFLQNSDNDLPLPFLYASIALLYMNILLVFYAQQAKISADKQREIEIAEHHYKMQELYYSQLQTEQNETRALFHDISKRMRAMDTLVSTSSSEQAKELLEETKNLYNSIGNVVDVGNSVISAILNEYKNRAEHEKIDFSFSVSVPEQLNISAIDCYIILGNTLDNAIDGTISVPEAERKIFLQLRQHQGTLFYKLENSCTQSHVTRKRSKNHGYGLRNVRKCIEKHAGDMVTSFENGKFTFTSRITC